MIEPNVNGPANPDTLPATDFEAVPSKVGGGKTMTVFGALFGAAAAVPT
jgi:hypothetical protein